MATTKKRSKRPSKTACKRRAKALPKKRTARAGKALAACRRPAKRRSVRNGWQDAHMKDFDGLIYVRRERLNSGGYTSTGKYFGIGAPLFHYFGEDDATDAWNARERAQTDPRDLWKFRPIEINDYLRAADRSDAVAKLKKLFPRARFSGVSRG